MTFVLAAAGSPGTSMLSLLVPAAMIFGAVMTLLSLPPLRRAVMQRISILHGYFYGPTEPATEAGDAGSETAPAQPVPGQAMASFDFSIYDDADDADEPTGP